MNTQQPPSERLAYLISAASSPYLVIFIFSLIVIGFNAPDVASFLLWGVLYVGCTAIAPFFFVWLGVKSGKITDLHVMLRQQRNTPLLLACICTCLLASAYYALHVPHNLMAMAIATVVCGIALILTTHITKVSVHTSAFTCSALSATVLASPWFGIVLFCLPAIVWARSKRGRHTVGQSLAGIALGGLASLGTYLAFGAI